MIFKFSFLAAILSFISIASASDLAPEIASNVELKKAVYADHAMVVTAHPLASKAALKIIQNGGNAIDAAIAAQLVLGLVEPQSSGIGGGAFLLHYNAQTKTIDGYDGRETAPEAVTENLFIVNNRPMSFMQAVKSGKAVGVPGVLAMLKQAHNDGGKLKFSELFKPAILLAEQGFSVTPRLQKSIAYATQFDMSPEFKLLYLNSDNTPLKTDQILKNPAYANVLKTISDNGIAAFYQGDLALRIANAVQARGGILKTEDLMHYTPIRRPALCGAYRSNRICGMPAPSSGTIAVLQTLKILEGFDLSEGDSPAMHHLILEAEKLAFADRNALVADSKFSELPIDEMLSNEYLATRRTLIDRENASSDIAREGIILHGADNTLDAPSTTHISIRDAQGNAVALTSSVEHSFGSSIMVDGFVLNNQMTDFAFNPIENGVPIANRVQPNKRPRSSMTPLFIFNNNEDLRYVLGSPGGSSIIGYVLNVINGVIDWQMPLQTALNQPHFLHRNKLVAEVELGYPYIEDLESIGHQVVEMPQTSGIHAVEITNDNTLIGAADPRREGLAIGY